MSTHSLKIEFLPALGLAGALLWGSGPAAAQQYEVLAYETFDYPAGPLGDLNGGYGWAEPWWSGSSKDYGLVTLPGFDPVGGKLTTNADHGGSYRKLDLRGLDKIVDQGAIGADGTTAWVSVEIQRVQPGDETYGEVILDWQWVQEGFAMGSPHPTDEWGIEQPWQTSSPHWVPNTSCDFKAHLVARIDFLPGDEHVFFWIDPPSNHPTTTADLEAWMYDFRFNNIGLKAGHGIPPGFDFDNLEISVNAFRPAFATSPVVGGSPTTATISNCTPGNGVMIGYSLAGGGPLSTTWGSAGLTPPVTRLGPYVADAGGTVSLTVTVPGALSGRTLWAQALELIPGGYSGGVLSNPYSVVVQ